MGGTQGPAHLVALASAGTGLSGLQDRVAAIGGTLHIDSPPGAGTIITARIPLRDSSGPTQEPGPQERDTAG